MCIFPSSSFGYSDKSALNGIEPIGIYGNGFKSGSMRLGKDAIVFSKSKSSSCVGMLSQSYLEDIGAQQIIVPIVCLEQGETNKYILNLLHQGILNHVKRRNLNVNIFLIYWHHESIVLSTELDTI